MVTIAGSGDGGRRIIESRQNVNVVAELRKRREARRHIEVSTGAARNPISLWNTIAVKPENESALDRFVGHFGRGIRTRCVCGPLRVEHAHQRRESHLNGRSRQRDALQERSARHSDPLSDYLRHEPVLLRWEIPATLPLRLSVL